MNETKSSELMDLVNVFTKECAVLPIECFYIEYFSVLKYLDRMWSISIPFYEEERMVIFE